MIGLGFGGAFGIYFLIRFLINKFGSKKILREKLKRTSKRYRNITWGLYIVGTIAFLTFYICILIYTFEIK